MKFDFLQMSVGIGIRNDNQIALWTKQLFLWQALGQETHDSVEELDRQYSSHFPGHLYSGNYSGNWLGSCTNQSKVSCAARSGQRRDVHSWCLLSAYKGRIFTRVF